MEERNTNFDLWYGFTHVIQKGDTLYKLSKQYHVKVSALILANPFVNIYNLQVGDEICIPRIRPVVIPVTPYPQPPYTLSLIHIYPDANECDHRFYHTGCK